MTTDRSSLLAVRNWLLDLWSFGRFCLSGVFRILHIVSNEKVENHESRNSRGWSWYATG